MKRLAIGFTFLGTIILAGPVSATAGFLGTSISEYDLVGCQNNSNNPRCKKVIQVACKSICYGHEDDNSQFGHACKEMCHLPVKQEMPEVGEPQTRMQ